MVKPAGVSMLVVRPGWLTTVQDRGRIGFQRYGMPVGGAMDQVALRAANRLVGNPDGAAVLEITVQGPKLRFEQDTLIAVTGGDLSPMLNGLPIPGWTASRVERGGTLTFGARRWGARAYLAISGGLDVPLVLGSRATHVRTKTGGIAGRALMTGDRLRCGLSGSPRDSRIGVTIPMAVRPPYQPVPTLRVIRGPQAERFLPETWATLTGNEYRLSAQSDRMGYCLTGPPLLHAGSADILSEATPLGSVQVPADRRPILLMADRQPTGGYPNLAVVITADLPLAAQLVPGDRLRFALVEPAEAHAALWAQHAGLDRVLPPVFP